MCLSDGCYDLYVGGGTWQNEVSWDFEHYQGEVGTTEVCVGDVTFVGAGESESESSLDLVSIFPDDPLMSDTSCFPSFGKMYNTAWEAL